MSFDNVLRWYELLEDDEIDDYGKVSMAFEMFCSACALDSELLVTGVDSIADYIHQEPYGHYDDNIGVGTSDPIRYYSYSQDADAIYSSFVEQYGIDLIQQQGKLHWDKFKA
ncbi:Gp15 family bacteriophage protein, partial [Leuconostoc falkenbergense]|uniref:Gp15 family bacteriophage protein n=1 Tax=Leuconostoc falkenbergense TaxID=2766470 RepID=UPI003BB03838